MAILAKSKAIRHFVSILIIRRLFHLLLQQPVAAPAFAIPFWADKDVRFPFVQKTKN
jgi:hypothetical protein